jgi:hypothetical protein
VDADSRHLRSVSPTALKIHRKDAFYWSPLSYPSRDKSVDFGIPCPFKVDSLLHYSDHILQRIYMDIQGTLEQLRQERSRINEAIAALEEVGQTAPRRGRPPKVSQAGQASASSAPKRRTMSAAARAKIAAAQRARWAKQKGNAAPKQAKGAQKKSGGRRAMSPAVRKRLSLLMKARWAARKKAS